MGGLSSELIDELNKQLNKNSDNNAFTDQEFDSITELSISKADVNSLGLFNNLRTIIISSFPSLSDSDLNTVLSDRQDITKLIIKEQSGLMNIDLSNLVNLKSLTIIDCDNLKHVNGLEKLVYVDNLSFYDNKVYELDDSLTDMVLRTTGNSDIDIEYYVDMIKKVNNLEVIKNINWIEYIGVRKPSFYKYSFEEILRLMDIISNITSRYIYVDDDQMTTFGILYNWMVNNVRFNNEDVNGENALINNSYDVFTKAMGGRLLYAKAFQLLLKVAGIESDLVYSLQALDNIGMFNGENVFSLLGSSDYALLRVNIDNRYYYVDVAFDSSIVNNDYYENLRLLLVSKEEIKLRHNLIGENNIHESFNYDKDNIDELLTYANDRIANVDKMFEDIDQDKEEMATCELVDKVLEKDIDTNPELMQSYIDNKNKNIELHNKRGNIILNYKNILFRNYVGIKEDTSEEDKNKLIDDLRHKKDIKLYSDYIFKIISKCF